MLTPEQLADYKRVTLAAIVDPTKQAESKFENMAYAMVPALIEGVERLQTALATKDHVLSQFADRDNWTYGGKPNSMLVVMIWQGRFNPVDIANQALSEGKE